jgi:hypothetical protein
VHYSRTPKGLRIDLQGYDQRWATLRYLFRTALQRHVPEMPTVRPSDFIGTKHSRLKLKIPVVDDSRRALIVGAGIGGLATGIALRRRGWNVRIYERRRSTLDLGFGLLLAQNAISALAELGIAKSVIGRTAPGHGVEVRHLNGRVIRRFSMQLGGPAVVALRRDLHDVLLDASDRTRSGSAVKR